MSMASQQEEAPAGEAEREPLEDQVAVERRSPVPRRPATLCSRKKRQKKVEKTWLR